MRLVYPPPDNGSDEAELSFSQQYYEIEAFAPDGAIAPNTCDWCGGTGNDEDLIFCAKCQGKGKV